MNWLTRLSLSGFILAIWLANSGQPVFAQADPPVVFCGDLSEADCSLLRDAKAAMRDLHALATSADIVYDLTDLPAFVIEGEPLDLASANIRLFYDSVYTIDEEAIRRLTILGEVNSNVASLALLVSPELALRIIDGINGEMKLVIQISPVLRDWLAEQADQPLPAEMRFVFRLVDSVLYVNLRELVEWVGEAPPGIDAEWVAFDLAELYAQMRAAPESGGGFVLASVVGALAQTRSGYSLAEIYQDLQKLGGLDPDLAPGDFVRIARAPDRQQRGQTYAVYVTTVDAQVMLSWVVRILNKLVPQFEPETAPTVSMMLMGLPTLANEMTLQTVLMIDQATGLVQRQESDFAWDMTMLTGLIGLAESMGESPIQIAGQSRTGPNLRLVSTIEYSDHDVASVVEAPVDVFVVPLADLLQD